MVLISQTLIPDTEEPADKLIEWMGLSGRNDDTVLDSLRDLNTTKKYATCKSVVGLCNPLIADCKSKEGHYYLCSLPLSRGGCRVMKGDWHLSTYECFGQQQQEAKSCDEKRGALLVMVLGVGAISRFQKFPLETFESSSQKPAFYVHIFVATCQANRYLVYYSHKCRICPTANSITIRISKRRHHVRRVYQFQPVLYPL